MQIVITDDVAGVHCPSRPRLRAALETLARPFVPDDRVHAKVHELIAALDELAKASSGGRGTTHQPSELPFRWAFADAGIRKIAPWLAQFGYMHVRRGSPGYVLVFEPATPVEQISQLAATIGNAVIVDGVDVNVVLAPVRDSLDYNSIVNLTPIFVTLDHVFSQHETYDPLSDDYVQIENVNDFVRLVLAANDYLSKGELGVTAQYDGGACNAQFVLQGWRNLTRGYDGNIIVERSTCWVPDTATYGAAELSFGLRFTATAGDLFAGSEELARLRKLAQQFCAALREADKDNPCLGRS